MAYIEEKKIKGKKYFYAAKNIRISRNKWKKIRKYIGADLSNIEKASKELELIQPVKRILTLKQMRIIDFLKENYLKKHKISKQMLKIEKDQMVSYIYNTNAIEGNSLSYEDTKNILDGKKTGLPKSKKRDVYEVQNMKHCIDFLFEYRGKVDLNLVLKLHTIQMAGIHPEAGKIRTKQNIVGTYLPPAPEKISSELNDFFSWFEKAESVLHPFELAGLAHLKFVRIHPFMDGNGRISRQLMNYILLKNQYPMLNIFNSEKMIYYLSLREVDAGKKERPFIKYLYEIYLNQYREYLKKFESQSSFIGIKQRIRK